MVLDLWSHGSVQPIPKRESLPKLTLAICRNVTLLSTAKGRGPFRPQAALGSGGYPCKRADVTWMEMFTSIRLDLLQRVFDKFKELTMTRHSRQ